MNHFTNSAFLAFVFSSVIGAYFVWQKKHSAAVRFFGFFWLTVAFWTYFVSNQFELLAHMSGFWWGWFLHIGCMYVPLIYFHFALHLTDHRKSHGLALKIGYGIFGFFVLLNTYTNLFTNEIVFRDAYAYPKPAVLYPLYIVFFQVFGFWGAYLIFRWAGELSKKIRQQTYLFLVLQFVAHVGAMDNYLIMYDIRWFPLYPYGLYLILPFAIFGSKFILNLKRG